ncbi:MAG: zinc-dependent metalloprotease, partial [Fimbriimonadales bacterium]|nr:zinc-dependent metalloprotease [Fimbriimonadales bacterium]
IVFWLDNAIPEEYRDAIREGILEWNKAFEKIGIKDAIVVKQMPDDADWDHADMRYNVVRWVSSPNNGYAVALFRVNPLTGQILNAGITIDGNMSRITRLIYQRSIDPLAAFREAEAWEKGHAMHDPRVCTIAEGSMLRAWTGYLMMELLAPRRNATRTTEDRFVKDYLRAIAMHEMGHILGLRHNFAASRLHSLDELANGELVRRQGMVASVMEYDPFNQMALHAPNTVYWNPTIGPYDYWAIEYGYKEFGVSTPEAEKPYLNEIARRNTEPALAYETDEYADRFDPDETRFDLGRDPLAYWELVLKDTTELVRALPKRFPRPGESYHEFTRVFFGTVANYSSAAVQLTRFIGALQIRRNFRGDPNAQPPLEPVNGATQRRALKLLVDYIFAEGAFNLPKSYYDKLAPNPVRGGGPIPPDAPVRDFLSNIQRLTLARLLAPDTLRRVVNNEFKQGNSKNAFTLAEMFRTLQDAIWSEASTGKPVNALRRLLQRAYVQQMTDLLVKSSNAPDDAKTL